MDDKFHDECGIFAVHGDPQRVDDRTVVTGRAPVGETQLDRDKGDAGSRARTDEIRRRRLARAFCHRSHRRASQELPSSDRHPPHSPKF